MAMVPYICSIWLVFTACTIWSLPVTSPQTTARPGVPTMDEHGYELVQIILNQTLYIKNEIKHIKAQLFGDRSLCPMFWLQSNSSCYHIPLYFQLNWQDAQVACQRMGAHLAVLDTQLENEALKALLSNEDASSTYNTNQPLWIGAYQYGNGGIWRWVDGQEMTYSDWTADVDEYRRGFYCLHWTTEGWTNFPCKKNANFICEKEINAELQDSDIYEN